MMNQLDSAASALGIPSGRKKTRRGGKAHKAPAIPGAPTAPTAPRPPAVEGVAGPAASGPAAPNGLSAITKHQNSLNDAIRGGDHKAAKNHALNLGNALHAMMGGSKVSNKAPMSAGAAPAFPGAALAGAGGLDADGDVDSGSGGDSYAPPPVGGGGSGNGGGLPFGKRTAMAKMFASSKPK